jgi:hypothetical protein
MVFNATFNIISVISRRSVLLVEENGVPSENHSQCLLSWLGPLDELDLKNFLIILFSILI